MSSVAGGIEFANARRDLGDLRLRSLGGPGPFVHPRSPEFPRRFGISADHMDVKMRNVIAEDKGIDVHLAQGFHQGPGQTRGMDGDGFRLLDRQVGQTRRMTFRLDEEMAEVVGSFSSKETGVRREDEGVLVDRPSRDAFLASVLSADHAFRVGIFVHRPSPRGWHSVATAVTKRFRQLSK